MSARKPTNEDDQAIFSKQKINFQPSAAITSVCTANNILVLSLANSTLLRIPLQHPDEQVEVSIPSDSSSTTISHTFIDPLGHHIICTTSNRQTFYVHAKSKEAKRLEKFSTHSITSIGWNRHLSSEQSTGAMLVGTSTGALIETIVRADGHVLYAKLVHQLARSTDGATSPTDGLPITSISLNRCASSTERWLCLVTTPGALHPFDGLIKAAIMRNAMSGQLVATSSTTSFTDDLYPTAAFFPAESTNRVKTLDPDAPVSSPSSLHVHPSVGDEAPETFAWHTHLGVLYGKVDSTQTDAFRTLVDDVLYSFPKTLGGRSQVPLFSALSEFHLLLLYNERLTAVSVLDQRVTYEDAFGLVRYPLVHAHEMRLQKFGKVVGMCRDAVSGLVWTCTERHVFKYRPDKEDRHVWRYYTEKGDFERARRHAVVDDEALETVHRRQAHSLVLEGKLNSAGEFLAMTSMSLESAALMLMRGGKGDVRASRDAVRGYLVRRLDTYDTRTERAQVTLLVMWLMDVHLAELADSRCGVTLTGDRQSTPQRHRQLLAHVHAFMQRADVLECLLQNRAAVYKLMADHGRFALGGLHAHAGDRDTHLHMATMAKDWDTVVRLTIAAGETHQALELMHKQRDASLYYEHVPALFAVDASLVIDACLLVADVLDHAMLVPLLHAVVVDVPMAKELVRYMDTVGGWRNDSTAEMAHNIAVSLFVRYGMHVELREYVRRHRRFMTEADLKGRQRQTFFNLHYALRLCQPIAALEDVCIELYCALALYEEAVRMALRIDNVPLARQCVLRAMNDRSPAGVMVERRTTSVDVDDMDELAVMIRQAQITQNNTSDEGVEHGAEYANDEQVRQLWLPIARHVIEKEGDISMCIDLLNASRGALHIQHILPFFPQFATIEHFKEPLCECLAEHSGKIDQLKAEMKEAETVTADIQGHVAKMKTRYTQHSSNVLCAECGDVAARSPFLVFPCKHAFHENCLEMLNASTADDGSTTGERDLADECPFCGLYSVMNVDTPLITAQEYISDMKSWEF